MRHLVWLTLLLSTAASAAINPAEYTRDVPYQLQLRPTTQIVEHFERDGEAYRRTTIVATVVAEHRDAPGIAAGDTVTIDWSVNLDAQRRARDAHDREYGTMPGPQFLHAPAPPQPDADGLIWANLQSDDASTTAPPPEAMAPETAWDADRRVGWILVPALHQYTFDRPG